MANDEKLQNLIAKQKINKKSDRFAVIVDTFCEMRNVTKKSSRIDFFYVLLNITLNYFKTTRFGV